MRCIVAVGLLSLAGVVCAPASGEVTFDWAKVADEGNAPNPADPGYGTVKYTYQISKHEVTNAQYAEFLNAVAKSDSHQLYNQKMHDNANGGITRNGADGGYSYTVKAGRENQPVIYVSWNDAARFVNWLNNGQGEGDTEKGVYDLSQETPTRSADARYFIPNAGEWYKAAYYDPALNKGDGGYYLYATRSNQPPVSQPPPGGKNSANYTNDDKDSKNGINNGFALTGAITWDSAQDYLTDVGAYKESASPYGTFDQCGNVTEWNEALGSDHSSRVFQGGHLGNTVGSITAKSRGVYKADKEELFLGFRVAGLP